MKRRTVAPRTMKPRRIGSYALAVSLSGLAPALADNIATAISVQTQAAAEQSGGMRVLAVGAGLAQEETIRTDQSGAARLKFVDETLLVMGPSSQIKLDKFVFDPNRKAKNFVLEATIGAFRFVTGKSNHSAYQIRTPVAIIGVRGTQFAFGIEGNEVTIVVTQGSVTSCTRATAAAAARCVNAAAGNTIVTTPAGSVVRRTLGAIPNVLRTVLTLPSPGNALPNLRDAMQGVRPLDRPVPSLTGAVPAPVNPTASAPSAPSLGGVAPSLDGLPSAGALPSTGGLPSIGGGAPRLPGLGR